MIVSQEKTKKKNCRADKCRVKGTSYKKVLPCWKKLDEKPGDTHVRRSTRTLKPPIKCFRGVVRVTCAHEVCGGLVGCVILLSAAQNIALITTCVDPVIPSSD